jgi:hypothetical protein
MYHVLRKLMALQRASLLPDVCRLYSVSFQLPFSLSASACMQAVAELLTRHSFRHCPRTHAHVLQLVCQLLMAAFNAQMSKLGAPGTDLFVSVACAILESGVLGQVLADLEDDWVSGTVLIGNEELQESAGESKGAKHKSLLVVGLFNDFLPMDSRVRFWFCGVSLSAEDAL